MKKLAWVVFGLAGVALAQSDIPTDISEWFRDTAALAAVVAGVVALIRKHIWKTLDGLYVAALSLVVGVALAYFGHRLGYVGGDWLAFGVMAGLGASGATAWLKGVVGGGGGSAPPAGDTRTDAGRARLR
ncbi:hypothetical protein CSW50_10080 [Thermus scotoductus]|uniref:Uncharacterized protein n=1 Tax=Thermus scotoductus TaxID=37636 RepID=A0A430R0M1_THESC|nr:hypothetical protein [Thermus scotoductus]RTH00929.1 hypothetical protein CSW50_10080 [Thermus scotoductus]RTI05576.1 hypothetical protein CSW30_11250 [Thermus scotoductus]